MTTFHAAVDHIDPDTLETTTTYCGTVDQAHVDQVRAIADLPDTERFVKEHPRLEGAFCVLREDGDLDVYVPVDAAEHRVYAPDPDAKSDDKDLPRGLSGPSYISGAIRLGSQSIGGASDSPSKPPRAVWHTTESPAGGNYLTSIGAYLIRVGAEPQVIYCPVTDRIGQFGPLTSSGRALRNDGSYRTNRTGRVCIQVEVLGYAKSPWTKGFDPSKKPNYQRLIAAMRAHGIPDVWPVGKPPATAAAATKRPKDIWENEGGHFGHSQIRGQDHWDPGAIDTAIVPGKANDSSSPSKPPATSTSITPKSRETAATMLKQQAAALKTWPFIPDVEKTHGLPVNLLIAVGSRETNLTNKIGDGGHGFGVWQRDNRWHDVDETYLKDVRKQAEDAAALLASNYKALKDWAYAVAAYNRGVTGVKEALAAGKSPDSVTAGGDYAADILGRLAHLQAAAPAPSSSTGTYTVEKGDTLSSIADDHNTTVAVLVKLNSLKDPNKLAIGQKLKVPGKTATPAAQPLEPFPGAAFFHGGRHSPIITALGRRLVALGFGKHYKGGPGPNWTNADKRNVQDFQRSRPELAGDADGIPGPKTWAALKVPKS